MLHPQNCAVLMFKQIATSAYVTVYESGIHCNTYCSIVENNDYTVSIVATGEKHV